MNNLVILQDEKNQVLTTNIWLDQEWRDEMLTWDPKHFNGIDRIRVRNNKMYYIYMYILLYNQYPRFS